MILFSPLWETMKEKNISQYSLIKDFGFSSGQLDRLRKNENVNTYTLNRLCEILDCNIEDIAIYEKNKPLTGLFFYICITHFVVSHTIKVRKIERR